jgi:hypothetical protein
VEWGSQENALERRSTGTPIRLPAATAALKTHPCSGEGAFVQQLNWLLL